MIGAVGLHGAPILLVRVHACATGNPENRSLAAKRHRPTLCSSTWQSPLLQKALEL